MKKGNLAFLLLFPFVISFLGVTAIVGTFSRIAKDLIDIEWNFESMSGLRVSKQPIILSAKQVYDKNATLAVDNDLIYEIENVDPEDEEVHAVLTRMDRADTLGNHEYRLLPVSPGEIYLTVSNAKKTVFKKTLMVIYEEGAILVSPKISDSGSRLDQNPYIGEYDDDGSFSKKQATKEYTVKILPELEVEDTKVTANSGNIRFDLDRGVLTIKDINNPVEDAYFTIKSPSAERRYNFKIVKDGINVYDYKTLLKCTNQSETGEIVCQQVNFESLTRYAKLDNKGYAVIKNGQPVASSSNNNTALFGNFLSYTSFGEIKTPKYSFKDEVYTFKTTGDTTYLQEWNAFAESDPKYRDSQLSDDRYAGLRVQKDYYGNGFTLNLHNLTYPYTTSGGAPALNADNLFRGPLYTYCLGDPAHFPVVGLYGQDNVGMYVDGDNIKIHDVKLKNCDYGDSYTFLDKTGTVLEIHGDHNLISSSSLSNGKNVIRVFEGKDNAIQGCRLSDGQNFLIDVGTNVSKRMNTAKQSQFLNVNGQNITDMLANYLRSGGAGEPILHAYMELGPLVQLMAGMMGAGGGMDEAAINSFLGLPKDGVPKATVHNAINKLRDAMDDKSIASDYQTVVTITDTTFFKTGISAIGIENLFNGPYMAFASPALLSLLFEKLGQSIIPYIPTGYNRVSYPVRVSLKGNCTFSDLKTVDEMDVNGLLQQDLTTFLTKVGGEQVKEYLERNKMIINLETVFPIKDVVKKIGAKYMKENRLTPVASYYGGGANHSLIDTTDMENRSLYSGAIDADLVDYFYTRSLGGGTAASLFNVMHRMVTMFSGFHPFRFSFYGSSAKAKGVVATNTESTTRRNVQ